MADEAGGGGSNDRLETAIREVNARITEEVLNLRARLLAVEQQLESVGREEGVVEEPPRRKKRGAGRAKREARMKGERRGKGERAKAAGAQRKERRRQASEAFEDPEALEDSEG